MTVIDRTNHHLFQPLLYQVATGILSDGEIAPATRDILKGYKNISVELGEVTGFDLETRTVTATKPNGPSVGHPYDSLIVAAGGGQSYFGHDEYEEFAPGMKTLADAITQRARIFGAFEMAELEEDAEKRTAWLTFVAVGGGPTGVEITGQIAELARRALNKNYRRFDPSKDVRVLLFEGGKEILAAFGDKLSDRATQELAKTGVEIHVGSIVTNIDADGVDVKGPDGTVTRYPSKTKIWAAGVAASPLAKLLADASGAECDRAGRIQVLPDCSLPGHPEVFAVGDMMALNDLPGVAEVAMQSGDPRRENDQQATPGQGDAAVQVPRPGQHGRGVPAPRRRQLPRDPPLGVPRLARLAGRAPHVHDRLQEPFHDSDPLDAQLPRRGPRRASDHGRPRNAGATRDGATAQHGPRLTRGSRPGCM